MTTPTLTVAEASARIISLRTTEGTSEFTHEGFIFVLQQDARIEAIDLGAEGRAFLSDDTTWMEV